MSKLKGLATGIGSLPHKDAQEALDLIFRYTPHIPFWPQLPRRDIREGMVSQFSENIPFLKMKQDGLYFESPDAKDRELELFYERVIAKDLDYFKLSEEFALGLHKFYQRLEKLDLNKIEIIKCQITGPFTFAASLKDKNGIPLLHDAVFLQAVSKGLVMKALWQVDFFKGFGKKIIIFIDEPYLGCFGSAYTPINREGVVKVLRELSEEIKSEGKKLNSQDVLVGVHCCGNTDWSMLMEVEGIDIISFDAFDFLDNFVLYTANLKDFLKKQKIICWGIVPTQEFTGKETPDFLVERVNSGIDRLVKKGMERDSLLENLLISPACGLGALDTESSGRILELLAETASSIRESL